ncbi:MAG: S8 family serine peptidase, partial [Bacteroidota bacterium]
MRYLVLLGLVCVSSVLGIAQEERQVFLHNDIHIPTTSESRSTSATWPDNNCHPDNGCYAILHFEELPSATQIVEMAELGIILMEFIPNISYLARYQGDLNLELPNYITAITEISSTHKRPAVSFGSTGGQEDDSEYYKLVAVPFPGINTVQLSERLIQLGANITAYYPKYVYYEISAELLPDILACPQLMFTEPQPSPFFSEGQGANGNGRITSLNQGPGQGYDGTGVSIAIGDDGRIIHLDTKGRIIDHTQYNLGDHAELTVGMASGAGNIDPSAQGAAPGATIHLFDINPHEHLTNAIANYQQDRIVITSTSYGDGCGDSYYIPAQTIDEQVNDLPILLHFFSAGNHGNDPCFNAYSILGAAADGSFYCTITGGRKMGKNVMTIGNTFTTDVLVSSSSRGPTPDGRLKPDMVVQGQQDNTLGPNNTYRPSSGTSAAAPTAAGAAAGLYQYYREANNGADPSSALIKAVMLNSADDMGREGPDFSYGWGRLNAGKSLRILQNQQYFNTTINHGQQQSFQIYIPAGTLQMKAMLYWHDPAGSLLSSRALVNDLDFSILSPTNQTHLPWIPSSVAHLDSLSQPARPGVDRINNAEQVVLNNPSSGFYQFQVAGFQIPQGPQNYFIVYELIQEPMAFTFPLDKSKFIPNEQATIAWDAVGNDGIFGLDFSVDGGQSWQVINNAIAGNRRNYQWWAPNISTSQLKFRLRRGNQQHISTGQAVLSATADFSISYQDANHALISWEA